MRAQVEYLIEELAKDIVGYIMQDDSSIELPTAIEKFYNSNTFKKLSDESTALYVESSAFIYELFLEETTEKKSSVKTL